MKTFYVEASAWLAFVWAIIAFCVGLAIGNSNNVIGFSLIIASVHLFFVWGVLLAYADKRREE